jgi:hypothetical protein
MLVPQMNHLKLMCNMLRIYLYFSRPTNLKALVTRFPIICLLTLLFYFLKCYLVETNTIYQKTLCQVFLSYGRAAHLALVVDVGSFNLQRTIWNRAAKQTVEYGYYRTYVPPLEALRLGAAGWGAVLTHSDTRKTPRLITHLY